MSSTDGATALASACDGVVKVYRTQAGEVHALKGIDAQFPAGTTTCVVGPSGSGKSSLLRILAAADTPTAGTVHVAGASVGELTLRGRRELRRKQIGFVFQRPSQNLVAHLTAREHIRHVALQRGVLDDSMALLDTVGLSHRTTHRPAELSGGEQQRLAFAQAAVGRPALIIADEPTAELDTRTATELLRTMRDLAALGSAVVFASHDALAMGAADRTLALRHGALLGEQLREGVSLSIIDSSGRIQLPPDTLEWFPGQRALVEINGREIRITPP